MAARFVVLLGSLLATVHPVGGVEIVPVESAAAPCESSPSGTYLNRLLSRVARLERALSAEQKARVAERADAARVREASRREETARLETLAGELRARGASLETAGTKTRELEASLSKLSAVVGSKDAEIAELRTANDKLRSTIEDRDRSLGAATAQVARLKKELAEAAVARDSQVTADRRELARLREQNAELAATTQKLRAAVDDRERSLAAKDARLARLEDEFAEARAARSSAAAVDREKLAVAHDRLDRAKAELARLNRENLEQQAMIDQLERGRTTVAGGPRRRALAAMPISGASGEADQLLVFPGGGQATDRLAHELSAALARRDEAERTIEKLKGSPSDRSAPAKVANLQRELGAIKSEILRLTVLMSGAGATAP